MTADDIRAAADKVAVAESDLSDAKAELRARVLAAIDEGMSHNAAAKAARVTRQTVYNWVAAR